MTSLQEAAINRFKSAKQRLEQAQKAVEAARASLEKVKDDASLAALASAEADSKLALNEYNDAAKAAHDLLD